MNQHFSLMIAQFNPCVGDLTKNLKRIKESYSRAVSSQVDLLAFPEMCLTGYQLQDLILKKAFLQEVEVAIKQLKTDLKGPTAALIGAPVFENNKIFNAYYLIKDGSHSIVSRKHHLPNTNVFDEKRVFSSGPIAGPFKVSGIKIGCPICEDLWFKDVTRRMVDAGADVLISPNGSPYSREKLDIRNKVVTRRSIEAGIPIVYLNMTGGQDDLVYDGASFVLNPGGKIAVSLPQFDEVEEIINFQVKDKVWLAMPGNKVRYGNIISQDYRAMVEAVKEYTSKSGFSKVLIGLSGGIDSALVATIATDALGPNNVLCVRLPSKFSSKGSLDDAALLIKNLNCSFETIPIDPANEVINGSLARVFDGYEEDLTEENIQSRLRGIILMALSNKFNMMLLTTGNKSEVAVGYSTIYGDMAGGYNPIKDLYKTRVFETCKWRNQHHSEWMMGPKGEIIPKSIIDKPPSAELRLDQRDDDSLPPYDILDGILSGLIDQDLGVNDLIGLGYDKKIIKKIETLIYLSEHKRFQAAPGPNLTDRAFWSGRRYPLVQQWRDQS